MQVGPGTPQLPAEVPVANGTYYLQSVGATAACPEGGGNGQFLTRVGECDTPQPLVLQPLVQNATLFAMWQLAQVPGVRRACAVMTCTSCVASSQAAHRHQHRCMFFSCSSTSFVILQA